MDGDYISESSYSFLKGESVQDTNTSSSTSTSTETDPETEVLKSEVQESTSSSQSETTERSEKQLNLNHIHYLKPKICNELKKLKFLSIFTAILITFLSVIALSSYLILNISHPKSNNSSDHPNNNNSIEIESIVFNKIDLPNPTKIPIQIRESTTMTKRSEVVRKTNQIEDRIDGPTTKIRPTTRPPSRRKMIKIRKIFEPILPSIKYGQIDSFNVCKNMAKGMSSSSNKSMNKRYELKNGFTDFDFTELKQLSVPRVNHFLSIQSKQVTATSYLQDMINSHKLPNPLRPTHLIIKQIKIEKTIYSVIMTRYKEFLCMQKNGKVKVVDISRFKIPNCLWLIHLDPSNHKNHIYNPNCCTTNAHTLSHRQSPSSKGPTISNRRLLPKSTISEIFKNNPDRKYISVIVKRNYNLCSLGMVRRKGRVRINNGKRVNYNSEEALWIVNGFEQK